MRPVLLSGEEEEVEEEEDDDEQARGNNNRLSLPPLLPLPFASPEAEAES